MNSPKLNVSLTDHENEDDKESSELEEELDGVGFVLK